MAPDKIPLDEIVKFWQSKGMVPCAEAQADGVPCPSVGRSCETCAMAVEALENARRYAIPPRRELGS